MPKAQETVIAFSLQKLFVSSYSVSLLALREDCFWVLFLKPSGRPNAHFHFQFYFHQLQGNKKKKCQKEFAFPWELPSIPHTFSQPSLPGIPVSKRKLKTQITTKHSTNILVMLFLLLKNHKLLVFCRQRQFLVTVTCLFTSRVTWRPHSTFNITYWSNHAIKLPAKQDVHRRYNSSSDTQFTDSTETEELEGPLKWVNSTLRK